MNYTTKLWSGAVMVSVCITPARYSLYVLCRPTLITSYKDLSDNVHETFFHGKEGPLGENIHGKRSTTCGRKVETNETKRKRSTRQYAAIGAVLKVGCRRLGHKNIERISSW